MDSLPEGFEPVAAPAAQNAQAAPAESPEPLPEGFEPVPAAELGRPITAAPSAWMTRMAHGQALAKKWGLDFVMSAPRGVLSGLAGTAVAGGQAAQLEMGQMPDVPGQEEATQILEKNVTGDLPKPQGMAGRIGESIAEVLSNPMTFLGPAGLGVKTVIGVGAGVGSELAGEATEGSKYETAARLLGGVAGGALFAGAASPLFRLKSGEVARVAVDQTGTPTLRVVGDFPPKPADFDNAAAAVAGPKAETAALRQKLIDAWENEGKHPAEVAAEAENDAFVRHDLSSAAAHPTDIPPLVSPDVQPLSAPGKIMADLSALKDRAFDVGRWIEQQLTPIASAPDHAIRYTTQYLSSLRRVQWDWDRLDQHLKETFTPEQREAIWRAMDEESVMRQSGETSEHMGLATLAPEDRAVASELTQHAITTRLQMLDREMVTTEGLPSYVPRVFKNKGGGEPMDLGAAARIRETTGTMLQRKYLTAEESEAAAKARFGDKTELIRDIRVLPMVLARQQRAIAAHDFIEGVRKFGQDIGDPQIIEGEKPSGDWFTLPDSDLADWKFRTGDDGKTFAAKVPIHIKGEWAGAIKAIQDTKFNAFDRLITEIKNRPLTLIMNSPFIHDSVVWSKALPSNPGNLLTFRFMRQGPQLLADQKFMHDMLDAGLVLWGRRAGFKQDITGVAEAPQLEPGRSLTSKLLAYVPGLFDEKAGTAVKRAVDAAGEFVHDKLLGEQVQKLQASLAYDVRETMRKKFPEIPEPVLNVMAAHEANRFGGSLPPEAMSSFSRGFANATLFSRQFTLGNIGVLKDAVKGPPEYVMGRIRDMLGAERSEEAAALADTMKGYARRHAFSVVMLDAAMFYGMGALLQSAVNTAIGGTPMSDEVAGYWHRLKQAASRVADHPLTPSSYLSFIPSLSPTFYHEPGKEGKILLGQRADGTAIYGRSVIGRMGEDYTGLLTSPSSYLLTKMAPLPRAFLEVLGNKDSFDKPIYDPKALKQGDVEQAWNLAKHFVEAELPMQQIKGAANLISGKGDYKDAISTFGPYMPPPMTVTASQGYPGGPIAGAIADHQRNERTAQDLAMSGIKDMVVNKGDLAGARRTMAQLGVKPGLQNFLIRNWLHPGLSKMSARNLAEFYNHASPLEIEILNGMRAH